MADIFIKQVYVEKVYLTFGLKPMMRKLEKDNAWDVRDICIIFLQKIDKQFLVLFEYLTVSLDKISNKKNYFENDKSFQFYIVNIERGHYIQVYVEKRIIRFKQWCLN